MIEPIARIRIELQDIEPRIWRRVDVPLSTTLFVLNDIIQVAMGWRGVHLFEFRVGDKVYSEPNPEDYLYGYRRYNAKSVRMKDLVERGVERFAFIYDLGDYWQHDVIIETVFDGGANIDYPIFVDGARRCPPEDVGGSTGFMEFLEAVLDPSHEEHARMIEWYGGPFDLRDINEKYVRMVLSWFADRRRGPLASHRSGRRNTRR